MASQVDEARQFIYNGQMPTADAAQPQPTADQPQPEAPPEASEADGLNPRVRELLAIPEVAEFARTEIARAENAEAFYARGLQENAKYVTALALQNFPETAGLTMEEAGHALAILAKKSPERAFAIRQQLQQPALMLQESQRVQQAMQARAQQEHAARMQAFRDEQDMRVMKARPELADRAVAKKFMDAAPIYLSELGFSKSDLENLMAGKSGVALFDARMQSIIIDALKYREAKMGISQPQSKPIPQVQRPGIARTKADVSASQIGGLYREMKNSSGQDQIDAAVAYLKAKRARG